MTRFIREGIAFFLLIAFLWGVGTFGEVPQRAVVINEVAWAGTAANSNDEWIELYNNTDGDLDLTGWRLVSDDGSPDIALEGTIPAHGFFLLERGDDETISDIPADQVYQGALKNSGERLRLLDPGGSIIDTANHDGGAWPAGTDAHSMPPNASMERIDPALEDTDENWASNDGVEINGHDADGNPLNGTPKALNSAFNLPPIAKFVFSPQRPVAGQAVSFDGSSSNDPDGQLVAFNWDFGDGATAEGQTASHKYEQVGSFTVRLVVTDDRGAQGEATEGLTVRAENKPPQADFTFSPESPTVDEVVQFTDRSSDSDGVIISWEWDFGDGEKSALRNPSHQFAEPGSYTVTLTVTDDDGASASAAAELEVVAANLPPVADFSYLPLEPTTQDEINFTDQSSDPDGEVVAWSWDFGDGSTSDIQSPSHRYAKSGHYTVTLTVTDDCGKTDEASQKISVKNVAPTANFNYTPEKPTDLDTIQFTDLSSDPDGEIVKWLWNFDDGTTSDVQTPSHRYADDGEYVVKLTVTDDDGAGASTSQTITVSNVAPTANFNYTPEKPTDADIIKFTDASSDPDGEIGEWSWDFGDETTSSEQNPEHQYQDAGIYTVTLQVTDDDGAEANASHKIQVINAPPVADFSFIPERPTIDDLIQFTDKSYDPSPTGHIAFWGWDFGDGTKVTGEQNPTHRYTKPGAYTITLTVIDEQGALARTSKEVTVTP